MKSLPKIGGLVAIYSCVCHSRKEPEHQNSENFFEFLSFVYEFLEKMFSGSIYFLGNNFAELLFLLQTFSQLSFYPFSICFPLNDMTLVAVFESN